ncbi:DNA adenine methylase [Herbiconiux ginsengi]|nr:DNA adenine methylase [Herbiconiux ginsengi]
MGSKRSQLQNGLGLQLQKVLKPGDRFVDLFSGSGAVAMFASQILPVHVTAVDLQMYAVALSGAVVRRTVPLDPGKFGSKWTSRASELIERDASVALERRMLSEALDAEKVQALREIATQHSDVFVRSYGGHYFSIEQALAIGTLRANLPTKPTEAEAALAALISSSSRSSASPGHTAQPFQPTKNALPHIDAIWRRNLLKEVASSLDGITSQHAQVEGRAVQADANEFAQNLEGNEVVFLDPPYSAAQYSRFYHVLEAVAVGGYTDVFGAGRAPHISDRSRSEYSMVSTARASLGRLLETLADRSCRVIATFPQGRASNGMSGMDIVADARQWFEVDSSVSRATFSTMGGNGSGRSARHQAQEMIITMYPK